MSSPNPSLQSSITAYADSVLREATRLAARMRSGFDADDIASDIVTKFLATPEVLMAQYPDPIQYAGACVGNACIAHDRRQRVQRCEGLRLKDNGDGTKSAGRRWISGDATIGESEESVFGLAEDTGGSFDEWVAERIDASREFQRCTAGLPADRVSEVVAVDGHGHEIKDVAARCGQRRETVSRRVNDTRQRMRQNLTAGRHAKDTPA